MRRRVSRDLGGRSTATLWPGVLCAARDSNPEPADSRTVVTVVRGCRRSPAAFGSANARCLRSSSVIYMCFVTIKCPNDQLLTVITDDLYAAAGGIPSVWRSPTTRQPGGSPRRDQGVRGAALSPGWRVVALEGGRRDATPCPPGPAAAVSWWLSRRGLPAGEGAVVGDRQDLLGDQTSS